MRSENQQQQIKHQQAETVLRAVTKSPAAESSGEPKDVDMSTTTAPSDQPVSSIQQSAFSNASPVYEWIQTTERRSSSSSDCVDSIPTMISSSSPDLEASNADSNAATYSPPIQSQMLISAPKLTGTSASAPGSETGRSVEDEGGCSRPIQRNKGRCFQCNKKVGLLGFQCRCGYDFCGNHRHADQHNCQFDYREFARRQLTKANQKVVADKLNRI